jgi:hypothetical protein
MLRKLAEHSFYLSQLAVLLMFGFFLARHWFIGRGTESNFRVRESDRARPPVGPAPPGTPRLQAPAEDLASARMKRAARLQLEGIRLDGAPHEVLGVRETAGRDEIQKAWRQLIKRYHPDQVGPPGSREWEDAQKIAEAINEARDRMLRNARGS